MAFIFYLAHYIPMASTKSDDEVDCMGRINLSPAEKELEKKKLYHIQEVYYSSWRNNLIHLLSKFVREHYSARDLHQLLGSKRRWSDQELLELFRQKMGPKKEETNLGLINAKRGQRRAAEIKVVLGPTLVGEVRASVESAKYLDLGSNDCVITKYIGTSMGFKMPDICASDIIDTPDSCKDIQYKKTDGKNIPFDDRSFSFVTMLQVMHHMTNLDEMLTSLTQKMKPGGLLLIREQDTNSPKNSKDAEDAKKLFDIEHMLYDVLLGGQPMDEFLKSYYSKFHNKIEWTAILEKHKFEFVKVGHLKNFNPTNYYYAVYRLRT
jgi:SAM-dependent methyltransferase